MAECEHKKYTKFRYDASAASVMTQKQRRYDMAKIQSNYECALILSNDLIGGKWKLRILWHILHGDNRYSLLIKAIRDISPKVLVSQLRELEESGILVKKVIDPNPPKVIVYDVPEKYEELKRLIEMICTFTREYASMNQIHIDG
jgi:DNA-binding HxlR family transcriptional regulator